MLTRGRLEGWKQAQSLLPSFETGRARARDPLRMTFVFVEPYIFETWIGGTRSRHGSAASRAAATCSTT